MRKFRSLLLGLFAFLSAFAQADEALLADLHTMSEQHRQANYELLYVMQQGSQLSAFRYRHAFAAQKQFAQLLRLDNDREEILLRDNVVTYIGKDFQPFSLSSPDILDHFPNVFHSDFSRLRENYEFFALGKSRIADRIANGIRILPKNDERYSYTLWLDDETSLLLKSELFDENNRLLEQFKVIRAFSSDHVLGIIEPILSLKLPMLLNPSYTEPDSYTWFLSELPRGFQLLGNTQKSQFDIGQGSLPVESRYYSDGLFSFNLYLTDNRELGLGEQFWQNGKLTVYTRNLDDKAAILVGDIPLSLAQKVVSHIRFDEKE